MKTISRAMLTCIATLSLFSAAFADDSTSSLPAATTAGNATFLSGGIGDDESNAIKQAAKQYPLELEFTINAAPRNEYAAGVQVKLFDSHHNALIDTVSNGPFFLATVPDGRYTIEATENGQTQTRKITVSARHHQHIAFAWAQDRS